MVTSEKIMMDKASGLENAKRRRDHIIRNLTITLLIGS